MKFDIGRALGSEKKVIIETSNDRILLVCNTSTHMSKSIFNSIKASLREYNFPIIEFRTWLDYDNLFELKYLIENFVNQNPQKPLYVSLPHYWDLATNYNVFEDLFDYFLTHRQVHFIFRTSSYLKVPATLRNHCSCLVFRNLKKTDEDYFSRLPSLKYNDYYSLNINDFIFYQDGKGTVVNQAKISFDD